MQRIDVQAIRKNLGLNRPEFWGRMGIADEEGSRFEQGSRLPESVLEILRLVHFDGLDLAKVTPADIQIIDYFNRQGLMDVFLEFRKKRQAMKPLMMTQ